MGRSPGMIISYGHQNGYMLCAVISETCVILTQVSDSIVPCSWDYMVMFAKDYLANSFNSTSLTTTLSLFPPAFRRDKPCGS